MKTDTAQKNIPGGWRATKFGDTASIIMGQSPEGSTYNKEGTGKALINGPTEFTELYPVKIQWTTAPTKLCKKGDILLCVRGSSTGRMNISDDEYCIGRGVAAIRASENMTQGYLRQEIKLVLGKIMSLASGSTFPSIDGKSIKEIPVFLPPLPEQTRIVKVLETWDKAIDVLAKKIEHKKGIKKGLMQNLLTGKIRLAGFEDMWKTQALSSLGIFSKGAGILKDQVVETGLNAVRYGELYTKYNYQIRKVHSHIPASIISETKKIKYGDILFAGSGETIDEIGKSAAYLIHKDAYAGGDIIIFTPKNSDSMFLSYFLNVGESRKKLRELGQGQSVVHLYKSDLEKIKLHIPAITEQKAIANILNLSENEICNLEKKLSLLKEQKTHLLNNLITGIIRTPVNI